MRNTYLLILLILTSLFLSFSSCSKKDNKKSIDDQSKQDTIPVKILTIEPQDFNEYGEYYGNIQGIKEAMIICYEGGKVEKINAKEGKRVKKGDRLAHIEIDRITATYETALLNEKVTKDNYDRLTKHLETGNSSQFEVDQAKLQWLNSKMNRIDAEKARKGAFCVSPLNGIITTRHIELYQELQPGSPTFTITQLHKVKVQIGIPESEIEGVKEGNEAQISFSVFPGHTWNGKIFRLTREASKISKTFQAILHIDNPDHSIKPGLTAYVKLLINKKENQIVIPTSALLFEGKSNYVMAIENNKAVRYDVETGKSNNNQTVILKGLSSGSSLIVKGQHIVTSGMIVKVMN